MFLSHLLHATVDPSWKVLLVLNHKQPFYRADYVLSEHSFEERQSSPVWFKNGTEKFSKETWIQIDDLCGRRPWPFPDKEFDFVICDHTLELVRDPLFICQELQRVGKTGYIESISPIVSFVKDLDRTGVVGYPHHRWFVEYGDRQIKFTHKNHLIQTMKEYHVEKPQEAKGLNPMVMINGVFWSETFSAVENKEDAEFPDWFFEEHFGNFKNLNPKRFFDVATPVPILLNRLPHETGKFVTIPELDIKFSIPMFNPDGQFNTEMFKFEAVLKQQGRL